MARERVPVVPAPSAEPVHPPPTRGGAFERHPNGSLLPIEETAERDRPPANTNEE